MQTNIRNQYSILIFILSTLLATAQLFVSYFYTESDTNSDNTNSQYSYFNKVAAPNQPPSYVFGIVWPILYSIFGYINLRTFDSPNLSETSRNKIIEHSITEAWLQTLWLLVSANFGSGGSFLQNFLGLNVMIILVLYCYLIRLPTLYKKDKTSFFLY